MQNTPLSRCTPHSPGQLGSTGTRRKQKLVAFAAVFAVAGTMALPMVVRADPVTWANVGTDWNATDWGGTLPGATDEAVLPAHGTTGLKNPSITNTENPIIADLSIDNSGGGVYSITGNGSLTLNGNGSGIGLTVTGGGTTNLSQTLGAILGANQTWNIGTGTTVTTKVVTGTGNTLTLTGSGTLNPTASTNAGIINWVVNGGTLLGTAYSSLNGGGGTTIIVNSGGTLEYLVTNGSQNGTGGATITLNDGSTLAVAASANIALTSTSPNANSSSGPTVASGAAVTIQTSSNPYDQLTLNAVLGGGNGASINVTGSGRLYLRGNGGYVGSWTINRGATLELYAFPGNLGSNNAVILNGGTLLSQAQNYTYNTGLNSLTVADNSNIQTDAFTGTSSPAANWYLGNLSIGAYTLTAGVVPTSLFTTLTSGNTHFYFGQSNNQYSGSLSVTLTGDATFNVVNPTYSGGYTTTVTLGTVVDSGGTYSLTKTGTGILQLMGTSTYHGDTNINAGTVALLPAGSVTGSTWTTATIANSPTITVASSATFDLSALTTSFTLGSTQTLTGGGNVQLATGHSLVNNGKIGGSLTISGGVSGSGSINPGNSPGILTADQVDPSGGLSFNFEFTGNTPTYGSPDASGNDVFRLTDAATPFVTSLGAGNTVNVYFDVATLTSGAYLGGFYTDEGGDFLASVGNATVQYFYLDSSGTVTYNGLQYSPLDAAAVTMNTTAAPADFGSGPVAGQITEFNVSVTPVPEPASLSLLGLAGLGLLLRRRRS